MGIKYNEIQDVKLDELWWQKKGLWFTSTGYGSKIPTSYKIKVAGRWYRIYARVFSNCATHYIARGKVEKGHIYELRNIVDADDVMQKFCEKGV